MDSVRGTCFSMVKIMEILFCPIFTARKRRTKFAKLMFLQVSVCPRGGGYVACGGHVWQGGMHGWGACMAGWGHVWRGGMHGWGHAWLLGHAWQGTGVHGRGGMGVVHGRMCMHSRGGMHATADTMGYQQ